MVTALQTPLSRKPLSLACRFSGLFWGAASLFSKWPSSNAARLPALRPPNCSFCGWRWWGNKKILRAEPIFSDYNLIFSGGPFFSKLEPFFYAGPRTEFSPHSKKKRSELPGPQPISLNFFQFRRRKLKGLKRLAAACRQQSFSRIAPLN